MTAPASRRAIVRSAPAATTLPRSDDRPSRVRRAAVIGPSRGGPRGGAGGGFKGRPQRRYPREAALEGRLSKAVPRGGPSGRPPLS